MAKANYNCSEQELYTICELAWNSCSSQLASFTAFKPKYTTSFISDKRLAIQAARELPDEQARNEAYETAGINLKKAAKKCTDKWQMLKRYIADAYPPDLQKPKLEAAGHDYFKNASNDNWDSVKGLTTSGLSFINNYEADLTANNNMPAGFKEEFKGLKEDFEKIHQKFLEAEENSAIGQDNKVTANNNIFSDLMSMLLDGQEIFKNDEPLLKQFVFSDLLYLASGAGTAGIKGLTVVQLIETPIPNAKVSIIGTTKTAFSNSVGQYEINQVASGIYTITAQAEGYQTITITNFEIKIGTVSTLNFKFQPNP